MASILNLVACGSQDGYFYDLCAKTLFHRQSIFEEKYCKNSSMQKQFAVTSSKDHLLDRNAEIIDNFMLTFSEPTRLIDLRFNTKLNLYNYLFGIIKNVYLFVGSEIVHRMTNSNLLAWLLLHDSDQIDAIESSHCIPLDILINCGICIASLQYHSIRIRIDYDQTELAKTVLTSKETIFLNNLNSFLNDIEGFTSLPKDVLLLCFEYLSMKEIKLLRHFAKHPEEIKNFESLGPVPQLNCLVNYKLVDLPLRQKMQNFEQVDSVFIKSQFLLYNSFCLKKNEKLNLTIDLHFSLLIAQLYFYVVAWNKKESSYEILDIIANSALIFNDDMIFDGLESNDGFYSRKQTLKIDKLIHKIKIPKAAIHTITFVNPTLFSQKDKIKYAASKCMNFSRIDYVGLKVCLVSPDTDEIRLEDYNNIQLHIGAFGPNTLRYKDGLGGVLYQV
jgi:hypothetical protein